MYSIHQKGKIIKENTKPFANQFSRMQWIRGYGLYQVMEISARKMVIKTNCNLLYIKKMAWDDIKNEKSIVYRYSLQNFLVANFKL